MTVKKAMKRFSIILFLLIIIALIYLVIPRVNNPNPEFQTKLVYGKPVNKEIKDILTPTENPKRTRSVVILQNEKIVFEYGPTDKIMNTASIRKSILGLLYGIAIDKGLINIKKTLSELKIDELTPLTAH